MPANPVMLSNSSDDEDDVFDFPPITSKVSCEDDDSYIYINEELNPLLSNTSDKSQQDSAPNHTESLTETESFSNYSDDETKTSEDEIWDEGYQQGYSKSQQETQQRMQALVEYCKAMQAIIQLQHTENSALSSENRRLKKDKSKLTDKNTKQGQQRQELKAKNTTLKYQMRFEQKQSALTFSLEAEKHQRKTNKLKQEIRRKDGVIEHLETILDRHTRASMGTDSEAPHRQRRTRAR
jgi:hypothetical protein